MIKGTITFVLVVLINIFYVYYLKSIKDNKPFAASAWSASINFASSVSAIFFVQENWIIIPSCMGSFIGTYIATKLEKKYADTFKQKY
jgi:hypothetical protein